MAKNKKNFAQTLLGRAYNASFRPSWVETHFPQFIPATVKFVRTGLVLNGNIHIVAYNMDLEVLFPSNNLILRT